MRRSLLLLVAVLSLLLAPTALAAKTAYPLHPGSHGKHVAALQWLLSGHRPNVFTKVKPTFHVKVNGSYGARTKAAVRLYRYELGFPKSQLDNPVTPHLIYLLEGKAHRPSAYVVRASARLKTVEPGATANALAIRTLELSQLGVMENPVGSNWGAQVALYQAATGAYHAAWCVSFQQGAFGVVTHLMFANDSAGVFYVLAYASARNWTYALPKVGRLVAFKDGQGHMGFVVKVTAHGFASTEGNQANGVHEVFHDLGARPEAFIGIPGVA